MAAAHTEIFSKRQKIYALCEQLMSDDAEPFWTGFCR